jgi:hypothetical protein
LLLSIITCLAFATKHSLTRVPFLPFFLSYHSRFLPFLLSQASCHRLIAEVLLGEITTTHSHTFYSFLFSDFFILQASCHRLIAEVLLGEIARRSSSDAAAGGGRSGYALAGTYIGISIVV